MEYYTFDNHYGDVRQFHKDITDKDKYLVCTCAKNENEYIVEWIEHYLNMGFDKIIICDNNDDESLLDVVKDYIDNGTVEVFDCRKMASFQVQFYSMFCSEGNYQWCGYFDCDEFLEIPAYMNVKDFLKNIKENCVSFHWLVYGSNGEYHQKKGNVQERFPEPVYPINSFKENAYIKSIVRGGDYYRNCWFNGSHIPLMTPMPVHNIGGYILDDSVSHTYFSPHYKMGYIKHYYTKSFDEWIKKSQRGWPDGTPTLSASKYFICNRNYNIPTSDYFVSLFGSPDIDEYRAAYKELLESYNVIQITNEKRTIATYIGNVMRLIGITTGHTFIIYGNHIDDNLYNIFLEHAFKTGNRVVFCFNHEEIWNTYLKFNNGVGETYYVLDFE